MHLSYFITKYFCPQFRRRNCSTQKLRVNARAFCSTRTSENIIAKTVTPRNRLNVSGMFYNASGKPRRKTNRKNSVDIQLEIITDHGDVVVLI